MHIHSTVANLIRVLRALCRFDSKKASTAKELRAIENAAFEDSGSENEDELQHNLASVSENLADPFSSRDTVTEETSFGSLDQWDHDHRLSRVNKYMSAGIRGIAMSETMDQQVIDS